MMETDLFASYPATAGWKRPGTSKDAALAIEASGAADKLRDRCLIALRIPQTPKEVAALLDVEITSIRPRLTELKLKGKIEETGERRDKQNVLVAV